VIWRILHEAIAEHGSALQKKTHQHLLVGRFDCQRRAGERTASLGISRNP
jgi:hypothetical protein